MSGVAVEVRDLTVAYRERPVLWDVDLDVPVGSLTALVGPNGAGKSTLLKVRSRITRPTSGRVELHGRVGSLLEVGTGFHPELTGRENIYLNGAILGMRRIPIKKAALQIYLSGQWRFRCNTLRNFPPS